MLVIKNGFQLFFWFKNSLRSERQKKQRQMYFFACTVLKKPSTSASFPSSIWLQLWHNGNVPFASEDQHAPLSNRDYRHHGKEIIPCVLLAGCGVFGPDVHSNRSLDWAFLRRGALMGGCGAAPGCLAMDPLGRPPTSGGSLADRVIGAVFIGEHAIARPDCRKNDMVVRMGVRG